MVYYLCGFILIFSTSLQAEPVPAGTPTRVEQEFKAAFAIKDNVSIKSLSKKINRELQAFVAGDEPAFPKVVKEAYHLDPNFLSYVFKDYYMDTPDFQVGRNNAVYRLRYRWVNLDRYHRFVLLPFLRFYWPDRCEVQFKEGYEFSKESQIVTVRETRFEFRDSAPPFIDTNDAPSPPWDFDEFIQHAASGVFRNYKMLPAKALEEHLKSSLKDIKISPRFEVETQRYRIHLNIKHPWGSGPNPEQSFIVTMDLSNYRPFGASQIGGRFLELEVEIERNASTKIFELATKNVDDVHAPELVSFSKRAKEALEKDLYSIRKRLLTLLEKETGLWALSPMAKYKRILNSYAKD